MRVLTARRDEPVGSQLVIAGGRMVKVEEAAPSPGTQVEVTDLFFNTPARKKFLKTTVTEFSHICQVVQQAALSWPGTHFTLRHNGREVLDYPSSASLRDRVLQVYGLRCLEQMVEVGVVRPGVRVEGLTVSALHTRSARTPQDLFVNRRPIRNATISHAIYDGYGTFLARGRHPVFVLFLEVDPERVDVNVHPTKREVRFSDQEMIHQAVRQAVREAVGGGPAEAKPTETVSGWPNLREEGTSPAARSQWSGWVESATKGSQLPCVDVPVGGTSGEDRAAPPAVQEAVQVYLSDRASDVLPLAQIRRTFLVAQVGSELQVIDQHTAHERVLFERLCRAWSSQQVLSQPLLIPESIDLPPHRAALLERYAPDLEKLGLQIEPFGGNSFVIRAVPALLGHLDHAALVQDLLDDLSQWNTTVSLEERMRPVLASLACHGAVRAGRAMELPEMKRLIEDWVAEGFPMTCPHGRRVALRLPEDELSRMFGRL
jgi:DNA mismatch repair protein MutL